MARSGVVPAFSSRWVTGSPQRGRHLDEAARIAARIRVWPRCMHVFGLSVAELRRGLRFDDVVDPGAAAADVLFGGLDPLEPGDRVEHRPRRARNALRVPEMAGILECDAERQRLSYGARLGQQLGHVDDVHLPVILQM